MGALDKNWKAFAALVRQAWLSRGGDPSDAAFLSNSQHCMDMWRQFEAEYDALDVPGEAMPRQPADTLRARAAEVPDVHDEVPDKPEKSAGQASTETHPA